MTYGLFSALGIELEYMVVDRASSAVRPIVDEIFRDVAGSYVGDWEDGRIAWSNELARHVVELKTNGPAASLAGVAADFQASVGRVQGVLARHGARLLGGGMHPTMDPAREFERWPHDYADVYAAYDRIFDCRGHGWANLQSCHVNLPFANDDEFGRLHIAARALLPLLPALAASSPFCDGEFTGWLDWRLQVYRHNQARVPRIAGLLVPEPVTTREQYFEQILRPIWRDIAPFDPDRLLQEEWLNSRGVVAKFFRDALEIRVLDCQEAPVCDLAIAGLVVEVLRALVAERWSPVAAQQALVTEELAALLLAVARDADQAVIAHAGLLRVLGLPDRPLPARDVWRSLADRVLPDAVWMAPELHRPLAVILERGPLARRLLAAVGERPDRAALIGLSTQLADCLAAGVVFGG